MYIYYTAYLLVCDNTDNGNATCAPELPATAGNGAAILVCKSSRVRATKVEATEYSVFGNQRTLGLLNSAGFPVEEYSTFLVEKLVVGELSKGRSRRRRRKRGEERRGPITRPPEYKQRIAS